MQASSKRDQAGPAAPMSALDQALARIDALRFETVADLRKRWDAGERPTHDIWGERIPVDPATQGEARAAIVETLASAAWETPAGIALGAEIRGGL